MNGKKLEELQRRLSEHFYNEAQLMIDIFEADLSSKEWEKLRAFMKEHPFHTAIEYLKNISSKVADSK